MWARILAFIFLLGWGAVARADSAAIPARADNTLFRNSTGAISNGSGPAFFVGANSQLNTRRGVISFAVADSIPAGSKIIGIELRLHVSNVSNTTPRVIAIHNLENAWGEGSSSSAGGSGAPADTGDATWLHTFYPDDFWVEPGGDFTVDTLATASVSDTGFYSWSSTDMVSAVQLWLDQPDLNFGWLLQGEEDEASSAKRIDSREVATWALRPVLTIEFEPPGSPVEPSTWGRVKGLYRPR